MDPVSSLIKFQKRLTFLVLLLGVCIVCDARSITRLQFREAENDEQTFAISNFSYFDSDIYLLGLYECRCNNSNTNSFEGYMGYRGFKDLGSKTPLGIVGRYQEWSDGSSNSIGVEYVFNRNSLMSNFLKQYDVSTFLQFFIKDGYSERGKVEIQHYYSIKNILSSRSSIRGYNIIHGYSSNSDKYVLNSWFDYIYRMSDDFDLLLRVSYLSDDLPQSGRQGVAIEYGVRVNF
ncbi:hypothetical protein NO559_11925 [Dasania sp. GY-MA-18]|uniref:Uncharacterized protein n=1 Tax=Dasania phycosphaerae TaxID=2950436 RepID=A0A9J6RMG5_9GAMM|nr:MULTISPECIES: hypothetical protein [Dasania]MCR8923485.1 hypothetical protein [Dasania sp. GY-MA-18]MCZ0865918.1 hypothetical protein [Dasania phycosphaerae]MCZ0869643.1 hypothetical protein [Dasania phycosphaerae]